MSQLAVAIQQLPCNRACCPVSERCDGVDGDACFVHTSYIQDVSRILFECGQKEADVTIASQMLLPLYTQLFKLQLVEMSLDNVMLLGRTVSVHPVLKEIRAVMKDIAHMWRIVGLAGGAQTTTPHPKKQENNYYELLAGLGETTPEETDVPATFDSRIGKQNSVSEKVNDILATVEAFDQTLDEDPVLHAIVEQGDLDIAVVGDFDPKRLPKNDEQQPPTHILQKG